MSDLIGRNEKHYPKPTLDQSIEAWCLLNDLIELGYPHNFQHEACHIRNYMYKVSDLIADAYRIKNGVEKEAA